MAYGDSIPDLAASRLKLGGLLGDCEIGLELSTKKGLIPYPVYLIEIPFHFDL